MPRARNIKPSLFKNEILGVADPLLTLLFEGLWCLADCNGVLENRPLRIKAEIFPYREISDLNIFLTELEMSGFIIRYFNAGTPLIEIVNFHKHQKPHPTEKASEYPIFTASDGISDLNVKKNGNILFKQPSSLNEDSGLLIEDSHTESVRANGKIATPVNPTSPEQQNLIQAVTKLAGFNTGFPPLKNAEWLAAIDHAGREGFTADDIPKMGVWAATWMTGNFTPGNIVTILAKWRLEKNANGTNGKHTQTDTETLASLGISA